MKNRSLSFRSWGLSFLLVLATLQAAQPTLDPLLAALWQIESSGRVNPPNGDHGQAIGPFQIHRAYWQDAVEFRPAIGGQYEDCHNAAYARKIVAAYLERYGRRFIEAGDLESLARIHNGGPQGWRSPKTLPYWRKVKAALGR